MRKPNLNNFGNKLKFKQRSKKQETISEKDLFIETMSLFIDVWDRSNETYDKYKINLLEYEESFFQIIEGFLLLKYGTWRTEIILWFIFARLDADNKVVPLTFRIEDNEEEQIYLKTATDLWDFLKKVEESNPNL